MKPRPLGLMLALAAAGIVAWATLPADPPTPAVQPPAPTPTGELKPGLLADYGVLQEVVPTPHFALAREQTPHPLVPPDFSVTYTGVIRILRGGVHRFELDTDGIVYAKLTINGSTQAEQRLDAGDYPVEIKYGTVDIGVGRPDVAYLQFRWSSDDFVAEPVPPRALLHHARDVGGYEAARTTVETYNCFACHEGDAGTLVARRGPDLSHVGTRVRHGWLYTKTHYVDDRRDVAAYLATLVGPRVRDLPTDDFRIARGKDLFESTGCALCHDLDVADKYTAGQLASLIREPLKVWPDGRMPDLLLERDEAAMIAEFLTAGGRETEFQPGDADHGCAIVAERGCAACHDGLGVENGAKAGPLRSGTCRVVGTHDVSAFRPATHDAPVHEMRRAVERLQCRKCHAPEVVGPPPIDEFPHKLRTEWLRDVLEGKRRIRPWEPLRMPDFGDAAVAPLVRGFPAASGDGPERRGPDHDPAAVADGIKSIGVGGLACIKCHDYRGYASIGTRGPDMVYMHDRMRFDWFRRWMLDPQRILPGTSMPAYFRDAASAEATILLLWNAMSLDRQMPLPNGVGEEASFVLRPATEPIVLRTFLPDCTPRSIAVGLPGFVSYAWDAGTCSLRYAWFGDFLDAAPTWAGRGGTPAKLLGKRFWEAPAEPGETKFLGYRLVDGYPEFHYRRDGVEVYELITPLADGVGLKRRLRIGAEERTEEIRK